ncbi:MAG: protein kinase [Gemmataceae bacterium]|nr:protein kinase [Gemmataceae bacterium]
MQPPSTDPGLPRQIGRYRILGKLGAGGMGTVYRVHDLDLQRDVALKVPRFWGPPEQQAKQAARFQREARAAARIWHPNVCPVFDVAEHDGSPYVVMALVEGETLAALLARQGPLDVGQVIALALQLLDALATVHALGIVHRDLKPGNILLDPTGRAVLTDFGLAHLVLQSEHLTSEGLIVGTPHYMAPEQAAGHANEIGPPADLYSLAVVLYQMLTGRRPFEGPPLTVLHRIVHEHPPPPSQFRPGLPDAVEGAILRAMRKDPSERFPDARAFAAALAPVLGAAPATTTDLPAPVGATTQPATRPGALRWALSRALGWLAGGVLVGIGALLVCVWLSRALSSEMFTREQRYLAENRIDLIPVFMMSFLALLAAWLGTMVWQLTESFFTPEGLLFWAKYGSEWEVKRVVLAGIPLDSRDDTGATALMRAAERGHTEVVKVLLLHGANPDLRNPFGQTALDIVQSTGRADIAAVLRQPCSTTGVPAPPLERVWRPRPVSALAVFSVLGSLVAGVWWMREIANPLSRGEFLAMSSAWPGIWVLLPLAAVPTAFFVIILGPLLRSHSVYPMLAPRRTRYDGRAEPS